MNISEDTTCLIWPPFQADEIERQPLKRSKYVINCLRAGGDYAISYRAEDLLQRKDYPYDDHVRARLTTILIKKRASGEKFPMVTQELIERATQAKSLSIDERAMRLLTLMKATIQADHEAVQFANHKVCVLALAFSESPDWGALEYILKHLVDKGWVGKPTVMTIEDTMAYNVTPAGHARIDELTTSQSVDAVTSSPGGHSRVDGRTAGTVSAQAFVAMWFDDSMNDVYDHAIKPAIEDAGYDPVRIDRIHFTNQIPEEIKTQIRRSRFIVADITHGDDGPRGGVYLEAGRALEQDIPVIFTAERGTKPHFDISQYPRLEWERDNLPAFRTALTNHILALKELGPGPRNT